LRPEPQISHSTSAWIRFLLTGFFFFRFGPFAPLLLYTLFPHQCCTAISLSALCLQFKSCHSSCSNFFFFFLSPLFLHPCPCHPLFFLPPGLQFFFRGNLRIESSELRKGLPLPSPALTDPSYDGKPRPGYHVKRSVLAHSFLHSYGNPSFPLFPMDNITNKIMEFCLYVYVYINVYSAAFPDSLPEAPPYNYSMCWHMSWLLVISTFLSPGSRFPSFSIVLLRVTFPLPFYLSATIGVSLP